MRQRHFSFVWAITQLAGIGIYKAKMIDAGDIDQEKIQWFIDTCQSGVDCQEIPLIVRISRWGWMETLPKISETTIGMTMKFLPDDGIYKEGGNYSRYDYEIFTRCCYLEGGT